MIRAPRGLAAQACIILLSCLLTFWLRLNADGFRDTEGHRAIPAFEMVQRLKEAPSAAVLGVPTLFERVYLRKPPGVSWAIGLASLTLGETEFAARAPSALCGTLGALASMVFARRWFGRRAGLPAGLAHALLPWFWTVHRTAEIEPLVMLATQVTCLALVHVSLAERVKQPMAWASGIGLGLAGMFAAKGPAGHAVVAGVMVGATIAARSWRPLGRVWVSLVIGLTLTGAILAWISWAASTATPDPVAPIVVQSPGEFLWRKGRIAEGLLLPLSALAAALPASLALPWALRVKDARARALAWACVASVALFTALGVANVRYTLPAATLLPVLAGFVVAHRHRLPSRALLGALMLGTPARSALILACASLVWTFAIEPRRGQTSGREPAHLLAQGAAASLASQPLAPGSNAELLADHIIEARPEVLFYLRRELGRHGVDLRVRWVDLAKVPDPAPRSIFVLVRSDRDSGEAQRFNESHVLIGATRLLAADVHRYRVILYRHTDD